MWICEFFHLTPVSLPLIGNPPLLICAGGETSGVTGLNSCLCWDLSSSAIDMVSVVVESNGIDDAVDWGLYSIIEKRIGEPKKDLQRNNLVMKSCSTNHCFLFNILLINCFSFNCFSTTTASDCTWPLFSSNPTGTNWIY